MSRRLVHFRHVARGLKGLAVVATLALPLGDPAVAGTGEAKPQGQAESTRPDARLKGFHAPKGIKVRVAAAEPTLVDPVAMAFDDHGNLFVAEWKSAERSYETWDTIASPEGGTTRVRRTRKSSTDLVKKLKDADGDGVYESSEVVLEGCELPTSLMFWKNSLYLTCVGRLEKWTDEDGDGRFESRVVVLDGFAAVDRRGLGGATLGVDGWLYLASGDDDNHVAGPDGSRGDLARTGGVFRARVDGSRVNVFAMGLRDPGKGLAFDGHFDPFLFDGDHDDGSKFQGVRLVNPAEDGHYGWRIRPGSRDGLADFDRAAVDGERVGTLPVVARLGRGSPSGLVIYDGVAFPEALRDTLIVPDASRRAVRGFKVETKGGSRTLKGESNLLTADDDQFRPIQVVIGADGAIYVLDRRGRPPGEGPIGGEGKTGRLYRLTWDGDGTNPSLPTKPNHWDRIVKATTEELVFKFLISNDHLEADRALRELIDRGPTSIVHFTGWASNQKAALYTRLLGIQGARQLWSDPVEAVMVGFLSDPEPDVRRLAAQALAWEPKSALPRLVSKLLPHLDDADVRVVREVVLAIGRHAEPRPQQVPATLFRWLLAHPQADSTVKDAFVRALERLGDAGVEEVALAIRTRRGVERESAVGCFTEFRTAAAAEKLDALVKIPDLSTAERVALVRHFQEFPSDVPVPTQSLVDWLIKHSDVEPEVKIAAMDACRLGGNPASTLVLILLGDDDEAVRQAATRIASRSRPPKSLEILLERLKARATPSAERLDLVRALRNAGPKAFDALDSAYLASDEPEFRQAALRSMADADRSRATPALEAALNGPDPVLRVQAARILGESARTATVLGKAFANRTLPRDDLPIVLEALRKNDNAENRKLLATIEEDATGGSTALNPSEILARLEQGADPWSGLGVFFRESSRCSSCHKVEGRGGSIGPPLAIAPAEELIRSILAPSKTIKARYESSKVTLKDGRTFVGIVASKDSKTVNLKQADGREVRIAPDLIESEAIEPGSTMPAHVAIDLTTDELADLVAFLRSKPVRDSLGHGPRKIDKVLAIGPFALGADRLRIPLDRVDPSKDFVGQDGSQSTWVPLEASGSGQFNLRGELGARPGRAYLAVEVRSPEDQTAVLRFAIEGASRVYLNGSRVSDLPEHDPTTLASAFQRAGSNAMASLPDLARLGLKSGSNLLIIAVDRLDDARGDVRAWLEIASTRPVEVRTPQN